MNPSTIPYSSNLFVNRTTEVTQVKTALDALVSGEDQPRIILFRGSRGYGKSWLSIHLHRDVIPRWREENKHKVISVWIGLDIKGVQAYGFKSSSGEIFYFDAGDADETSDNKENSDVARSMKVDQQLPELLTGNLLHAFAEHIDAYRSKEVMEAPRTQWIIDELKEKFLGENPTYVAVIVDSVFETDWSHLRELERALLAPLSELPNILLILTGRGRDYIWNTAAFRTVKPINLDKLEKNDIEDQIRDQLFNQEADLSEDRKQKIIADVIKYSGGYPLNNFLVGRSLLHPDEWKTNLDILLEAYQNLTVRHRAIIKALSVLSPIARFRDEEIETLVPVLPNPPSNLRQLRQELAERQVIRWQGGGWLMDEALAAFQYAMMRLNLHEQGICRQLHHAALNMYCKWQDELHDATIFAKEIQFHENALSELEPHLSETI